MQTSWLRESWRDKILINWELMKPAFYKPSGPSFPAKQSSYLSVAVAHTPGGIDAYTEEAFFLHCDGDVSQLTTHSRLLSSNRRESKAGLTSSWTREQTIRNSKCFNCHGF